MDAPSTEKSVIGGQIFSLKTKVRVHLPFFDGVTRASTLSNKPDLHQNARVVAHETGNSRQEGWVPQRAEWVVRQTYCRRLRRSSESSPRVHLKPDWHLSPAKSSSWNAARPFQNL